MGLSPGRWVSRMGRAVKWLPWLLLIVLSLATLAGCRPKDRDTCNSETCEEPEQPPIGVQTCDLHAFDETPDDAPQGVCIPHLDAGWHTALVKTAPQTEPKPKCPAVAEWAGLVGDEIVPPGNEPRHIVGCSVFPLATCNSLNWACVPFAAGYTACVLKDDQSQCEGPYKFEALVAPEGGGDPTIVCCDSPKGD